MWEVSEDDTKPLYDVKVEPPKDLGFRDSKVSKYRKLNTNSLRFLVLGDVLEVSVAN